MNIRYFSGIPLFGNIFQPGMRSKWMLAILGGLTGGIACNKVIQIEAPPASIPQAQVFASDAQAISALSGAYYQLANSHVPTLVNGGMTIYPALSADELLVYDQGNTAALQFGRNRIAVDNYVLGDYLWSTAYKSIYQFNALLEGVQLSASLSAQVRDRLRGHGYFGRALLHYQLVQVFDAIPIVTTTDWRTTGMQSQGSAEQVYSQVISDLQQAIALLGVSYDLLQGGKLIANRYAAMALLARVYVQTGQWQQARELCDQVIGSGQYQLATDPAAVYTINNPEVLLQWQQDATGWSFNATQEGLLLLPIGGGFPFPPFAYLSASLLGAFEPGDVRKDQWTRQRIIGAQNLYYPARYKIGPSQASPGEPLTEGYVVLRLAEIILLRAECRLHLQDRMGAVDDLNSIRVRATLPPLVAELTTAQVEQALEQERRIELFCEWGHRWNDLKRWGKAVETLSRHKGISVTLNSLRYPIPATELLSNPLLRQHAGY